VAEIDVSVAEDRLIDALHAKSWQRVIDEMLTDTSLNADAQRLVESASQVTAQIRTRIGLERERAMALLGDAGISCWPHGEAEGVAPATSIGLGKSDVARAIEVLERQGYLLEYRLSPGAERARELIEARIVMVPTSEAIARITLIWPSSQAFSNRLTPRPPDLMSLATPTWAWPIYWLVRPVRRLVTAIRGNRSGGNLAPYFSTPSELIPSLLEGLAPTADDLLVDLGCGDGRVLIAASQLFGCRGRGIESDERLVDEANLRVAAAGLVDRVEIVAGDAASADLSDATIIFIFLPAGPAARLLPALLGGLSPGARVIAHEQSRVLWPTPPNSRHLILHPNGLTVAYTWEA
jgi:SAM-dependent methyltransferase